MTSKSKDVLLEISEIKMERVGFHVLGTSPMIMNRFSQKAWQELLLPSARRSRASLEAALKHDPVAEFRGGLYRCRDAKAPTLIHVPNGAFHGALAQAGIDVPGAAKAKIERLTRVVDVTVHLYGVPHLFCSMVRNSDMNRTPDVRTRPIFPEWACEVTVQYMAGVLNHKTVSNLFSAAGIIVGVGDWRGAKGGPYGAWTIVEQNNADYRRIRKEQARKAQQKAYDEPVYFDEDTEELLTWFNKEVALREKEVPSSRRVIIEDGEGFYQGPEIKGGNGSAATL